MNKNIKIPLRYATIVLIFLVGSLNISPIHVSADGPAEQDIKDTIQIYFTLRYAELKTLHAADFSRVLDESDPITANWRQMEKNRFEIKRRIAATFEENILDVKFFLDYPTLNIAGQTATVSVLESNEIIYSSDPSDPAKMADLPHEITLKIKGGRWVIQKDRYEDEFTYVLTHTSLDEAFKNIQINYELLTKKEETAPFSNEPMPSADLGAYPYHDSAAAMYANTYWGTKGWLPSPVMTAPGKQATWLNRYKSYSVDCANFVSQAIFQGTSATASDPNYFYPAVNYNTGWYYKFAPGVDGSYAWVNVGGLYNFLLSNQNGARGPAGFRIGICDTRAGQPIMMKVNNAWAHVVIVGAVKSCADIRVNSHTTNYYHTPLSTYSAYVLFPVYVRWYYK